MNEEEPSSPHHDSDSVNNEKQYKPYLYIRTIYSWFFIILFNSALCFSLGLGTNDELSGILAMIAGILTFYALYITLDWWLWREGFYKLRFNMRVSATLKGLTQLWPMLEFMAGSFASAVTKRVIPEQGFFQSYTITIITGILLSIVVAIIMSIFHGCYLLHKKSVSYP